MFILGLSGFIALVFLGGGLIVWLVRLVLRRRPRLLPVLKWTGLSYLIVLPLVIFVGLPTLSAWLIAHAGTRPDDRRLQIDPASFGCRFSTVSFVSRDGVELEGWWMPAAAGKAAIGITHGLFRDRKEVVERACRLNQEGYPALVFDLRRHGASRGDTISLGFRERLDVLGAFDELRRLGQTQVVLMGVSMGASATLLTLPELDGQVVAMVADSPFASLDETVRRHLDLFLSLPAFPFVPVFEFALGRFAGFDPGSLDVVRVVSQDRKTPILLLYGAEDQRMPPATAEQIYRAIAPQLREKVVFPGARHAAAWRTDPQRYLEVIQQFLQPLTADSGAVTDLEKAPAPH